MVLFDTTGTLYLSSPRLGFMIVLNLDLFVYRGDTLTNQRVIMIRIDQLSKSFEPQHIDGEIGTLKHALIKPSPSLFIADTSNTVHLL